MKILDFKYVDIDKLTVSEENVRKIELTKGSLSSLADSIRRFGVVNPIIITENYEIVVGRRRWRASRLVWEFTRKEKFRMIPCLIARFEPKFGNDPRIEMRLVSFMENMTRKWLKKDEEAEAVDALKKRGLTKIEIANVLGASKQIVDSLLNREYQEWE